MFICLVISPHTEYLNLYFSLSLSLSLRETQGEGEGGFFMLGSDDIEFIEAKSLGSWNYCLVL